jgi:ribonuclease HI
VKNRELWMRLDELTRGGKVSWQYVRGHAGNRYNEECDRRANEMARQAAKLAPTAGGSTARGGTGQARPSQRR